MAKFVPLQLILSAVLMFISNVIYASEVVVANIEIHGLDRTEERVVLRELPFHSGEVWDQAYINTSERRLRNLGIFSEAVVYPPDEQGRVVIHLKERWSLWLLPQGTRKDNGASSLSVVMDEYNLWGLNHHARFAYKRDTGTNFSSLKGVSYEGSYVWRRVADSRFDISANGTWGRSIYDTYDLGVNTAQYLQRSKGGAFTLRYAFGEVPGEGWSMVAGFSGSNSTFRFLSGVPQNDVVGNRVRAINSGVSYRQIDDHITWITGVAFDYALSVAHKGLGSSVKVYTHTASWRDYYAFSGQNTINFRIAGGQMAGDVLRSGVFDIGNRNELRGYYPGELQGTHYIYGTIEGRFPIRAASNFQLVAFTDVGKIGGNVGTSVSRGLAVGAGGGFRWTMRWLVNGTLRGDVAYGVASKRWRFYLGTGQAF